MAEKFIEQPNFKLQHIYRALEVIAKESDFIQAKLYENKLGKKYTCHEILEKLKEMDFYKVKDEGYVPAYIRDDLTDDLHEAFSFRTDYQIVSKKQMKNIFKVTKK